MSSVLTWKDIVAIKDITGATDGGHVYLGELQPRDSVTRTATGEIDLTKPHHPGVWTPLHQTHLAFPATYRDGRVGDLLAVATKGRSSRAAEHFGKLVVLKQNQRITHLGVVRTATNLNSIAPNPTADGSDAFTYFMWLEILALDPEGFEMPQQYRDNAVGLNGAGGVYVELELRDFAAVNGTLADFQRQVWNLFRAIRAPGNILSCTRPAIRP